jgi:hypothetical protein
MGQLLLCVDIEITRKIPDSCRISIEICGYILITAFANFAKWLFDFCIYAKCVAFAFLNVCNFLTKKYEKHKNITKN